MNRLVPQNKSEKDGHRVARQYTEFLAMIARLMPFVPPKIMQQLVTGKITQQLFNQTLEAFFFFCQEGFEAGERDGSLASLFGAYFEGWKIELYRPRIFRTVFKNLPKHSEFFGYDVKIIKICIESILSNDAHVSVVDNSRAEQETDLQRVFFATKQGEGVLKISDIRRNSDYIGHRLFGVWFGIALFTEHGHESLQWLRMNKKVREIVFLGSVLENQELAATCRPFVLSLVCNDGIWTKRHIPVDSVVTNEMQFPMIPQLQSEE